MLTLQREMVPALGVTSVVLCMYCGMSGFSGRYERPFHAMIYMQCPCVISSHIYWATNRLELALGSIVARAEVNQSRSGSEQK